MIEENVHKRSLDGIQFLLPLVSVGLNKLYYVVQSRVATPMEAVGAPTYRVAFVSDLILLGFLALQLLCITVASVFALRPPIKVPGAILAAIPVIFAVVVFFTQAWVLPLVLFWLPCSHFGTRHCGI